MATEPSNQEIRDATKDGLKRIYLIVIGLAITQALRVVFLDNNMPRDFSKLPWHTIIEVFGNLVSFLFYAVAFAHGSVLYLTCYARIDFWKINFAMLLLQSILFSISSFYILDFWFYSKFLLFIIVVDTCWIFSCAGAERKDKSVSLFKRIIPQDKLHKIWLRLNAIMAMVLLIVHILSTLLPAYIFATSVALVAVGIMSWFYWKHGNEYCFPGDSTSPTS